ncbi:TonB-dependent receptor plug domain-containing protein [Sphingomonas yunnanensis]|nr:TonB-dependent receptor plug domain-containing protein [Sphingomonas yunnanensis]
MTRQAAAIARLSATAAAVAAAPALAQVDAPVAGAAGATGGITGAPDDAAGKEVVVTGIRRANAAAIAAKRSATNIVDVVSATDVRALPDATIVEALRRIPGLSVLPATDNEHPRDEAATPVLRGLGPSYNNVTIDGLTIASPGTPNGTLGSITRGTRLDILPSSMVGEIQVVKTFTPDLDPNATGGAVNLRTRSAFEHGGATFLTAERSLGHVSDNGKPRDQPDPGAPVIATASTTLGAAHQFGATLSANYQSLASFTETHMTTDTVHYGFYDDAGELLSGSALGIGFAVPQQDKYWYAGAGAGARADHAQPRRQGEHLRRGRRRGAPRRDGARDHPQERGGHRDAGHGGRADLRRPRLYADPAQPGEARRSRRAAAPPMCVPGASARRRAAAAEPDAARPGERGGARVRRAAVGQQPVGRPRRRLPRRPRRAA